MIELPDEMSPIVVDFRSKCYDTDKWAAFHRDFTWYLEETDSREYCGESNSIYVRKFDGLFTWYPYTCKNWLCSNCAPRKAVAHLRWMIHQIIKMDGIYFAVIPLGSFDSPDSTNKMETIRERLRQRSSTQKAQYCAIRRSSRIEGKHLSFAYILAAKPLDGYKEPKLMHHVSKNMAIKLACYVFSVPGIWPSGISYSRGWTVKEPKKEESTHRYVTHGSEENLKKALKELGLRTAPVDEEAQLKVIAQVKDRVDELEKAARQRASTS